MRNEKRNSIAEKPNTSENSGFSGTIHTQRHYVWLDEKGCRCVPATPSRALLPLYRTTGVAAGHEHAEQN